MPQKKTPWFSIAINIGNQTAHRKHEVNGNENTQAGGNMSLPRQNLSSSDASYLTGILCEIANDIQELDFDSFYMCLKLFENYRVMSKGRPFQEYNAPKNERERYILPWNTAVKEWIKKNGHTLKEVADMIGLAESTLKKKSANGGYDFTLVDISKILELSKTSQYPIEIPFVGEMIKSREMAMRQVLKRALIEQSISQFPQES